MQVFVPPLFVLMLPPLPVFPLGALPPLPLLPLPTLLLAEPPLLSPPPRLSPESTGPSRLLPPLVTLIVPLQSSPTAPLCPRHLLLLQTRPASPEPTSPLRVLLPISTPILPPLPPPLLPPGLSSDARDRPWVACAPPSRARSHRLLAGGCCSYALRCLQ
jgi:hypothetical protein